MMTSTISRVTRTGACYSLAVLILLYLPCIYGLALQSRTTFSPDVRIDPTTGSEFIYSTWLLSERIQIIYPLEPTNRSRLTGMVFRSLPSWVRRRAQSMEDQSGILVCESYGWPLKWVGVDRDRPRDQEPSTTGELRMPGGWRLPILLRGMRSGMIVFISAICGLVVAYVHLSGVRLLRVTSGRCPRCGYDIKTLGNCCPECGCRIKPRCTPSVSAP